MSRAFKLAFILALIVVFAPASEATCPGDPPYDECDQYAIEYYVYSDAELTCLVGIHYYGCPNNYYETHWGSTTGHWIANRCWQCTYGC